MLIAALSSLADVANALPPGAGEVSLRFDPFERPDLWQPAGSDPDSRARPEPGWQPTLRATLVAGAGSLANLGGSVLQLGEEAHGYRLREVRRWEALFEKGGVTLVLPVEAAEEGMGR